MLLGDDGTLDTVIVCSECGAEMRFNFDGGDSDGCQHGCAPEANCSHEYDDFVEWAKEQAAEDHECEVSHD